MKTYFATFITGMQKPVEAVLRERLPDCRVVLMMDGAVVFETGVAHDALGVFCFNNVFELIEKVRVEGKVDLSTQMTRILRICADKKTNEKKIRVHSCPFVVQKTQSGQKNVLNHEWTQINTNGKLGSKTFRIVTSCENQLVAVDHNVRGAFENFIARRTGLAVERRGGGEEFWVLYRSEGWCFFMRRLSRHPAHEKVLARGELQPELAWLLNFIASPKPDDVCLDPFCGHGSIPFQGIKHFLMKKFYAFDSDAEVLEDAKKKFLDCKKVDVADLLKEIPEKSVDCIVTDPPWGIYKEVAGGVEGFYAGFVEKFSKVLKPGGRMVVLTAQREAFENALASCGGWRVGEVWPVLVSGKKAAVYKVVSE